MLFLFGGLLKYHVSGSELAVKQAVVMPAAAQGFLWRGAGMTAGWVAGGGRTSFLPAFAELRKQGLDLLEGDAGRRLLGHLIHWETGEEVDYNQECDIGEDDLFSDLLARGVGGTTDDLPGGDPDRHGRV